MAREIAIARFGGPEVLQLREAAESPPGPGELRIRQVAIGVNFTDVHGRRGDYAHLRNAPMPLVLGMEAAGVVEAAGEGAGGFRAGDRVAYASAPLGAYRDVRNFPSARCVPLPAGIAERDAAAILLKGLTVHMLVRRVRPVPAVGVLAGQWLRALGVRAIGVVGDESKLPAAQAAGYEAVFVRRRDDWPARVRELSGGGAAAVYDPVGRETWEGSLSCLAPRGHLVCYGNSSGLVPPFQVNELRDRGSLTVSWVRFSDYTASPGELQSAAGELFDALAGGTLRRPAPRCLPLAQAAEAHRLLESGRTTGPLVLEPEGG
jgi:NADPH2:quinone reductase